MLRDFKLTSAHPIIAFCILASIVPHAALGQPSEAARRAEAEAAARSRAMAEAAAKAQGITARTGRAQSPVQNQIDTSPRDPKELQQREEALQTAQQEAQRRKAAFDQLWRQSQRIKAYVAAADADLLHLRLRLDSLKQLASDNTRAAIDAEKNEMGTLDAAIRTAVAKLDALDSQSREALHLLDQAAVGATVDPEKPIICGDCLRISGAFDGSYDGIYAVRQGGYIILPRIGRVLLAGRSLPAAEKVIESKFADQSLPASKISIKRSCLPISAESSGQVFLIGEFAKPGAVTIPADSPTMVGVISKAGGVTATADLHNVRLLRTINGANVVEEINVGAMIDGAGLSSDLAVAPGDVIAMSSYTSFVYVTGAVARADAIRLYQEEELSALSAIARSGGFTKSASPESVFVVRDHGNGQKSRIPVNIKDVEAGKTPDVILRGRDVIVVPETSGLLGR